MRKVTLKCPTKSIQIIQNRAYEQGWFSIDLILNAVGNNLNVSLKNLKSDFKNILIVDRFS